MSVGSKALIGRRGLVKRNSRKILFEIIIVNMIQKVFKIDFKVSVVIHNIGIVDDAVCRIGDIVKMNRRLSTPSVKTVISLGQH